MHDTGGDTVDLIIMETKDGEGVVVKQQLLTIIDNLDNDDLRGFWLMTAVFFVCNTVDFELHLQVVEVGLRHGPLHVK